MTKKLRKSLLFIYSAGGLVTAVAPVVIECKGLWIGWSGIHDLTLEDKIPEADPDDKAPTAGLLSEQVSDTYLEMYHRTIRGVEASVFALYSQGREINPVRSNELFNSGIK